MVKVVIRDCQNCSWGFNSEQTTPFKESYLERAMMKVRSSIPDEILFSVRFIRFIIRQQKSELKIDFVRPFVCETPKKFKIPPIDNKEKSIFFEQVHQECVRLKLN